MIVAPHKYIGKHTSPRRARARPQGFFDGAGFTLIELMVVVAILSVLLTYGAISLRGNEQYRNKEKAKGQMKALERAMKDFYSDFGYYPSSGPASGGIYGLGLQAGAGMTPWERSLVQVQNPATAAPYLQPGMSESPSRYLRQVSPDPWNHRWIFVDGSRNPDIVTCIISMGPDGRANVDPADVTAAYNAGTKFPWSADAYNLYPPGRDGFSIIKQPTGEETEYDVVIYMETP